MADVPSVHLNSGHAMPQLGFGVFKVPLDETERAVTAAIQAGYRSLDTAAMYGNEEGVGAAIDKAGLAREELFVTTKLNNDAHGYDSAFTAFEDSRSKLGLDYIDLYLIHWPLPAQDSYVDTWRALIKMRDDGLIRSVGVSNFVPAHIDRLVDETGVTPAVNQVELHPYFVQSELRDYDRAHEVATEAWSPLAKGGDLLTDQRVVGLAEKYGKTPAQVVLRWHIELGNVVIPKSVTPSRIAENFDLWDVELAAEDVEAITALDRDTQGRTGPDPETFNP
jgi:diketogulonate reductase-like aldo/keto reductase